MKKIKLLLSLLLITLSLTNCSNEENLNVENTTTTDLINIHSQMKEKFENFSSISKNQKNLYSKSDEVKLKEYIDGIYNANYDYAIANGVESLFSEYGLNSDLIDVAEWAIQNINDEDLYSKLYSKFSINNQSDANLLFYYIEIYKQFNLNNSLFGKSLYANKGSGCGRAVVGTLVVTAIFTGVAIWTGGVGLPAAVGFFAAKGWATYNIAAACTEAQVLQEIKAPFLEKELIFIKDQKDINIKLPVILNND